MRSLCVLCLWLGLTLAGRASELFLRYEQEGREAITVQGGVLRRERAGASAEQRTVLAPAQRARFDQWIDDHRLFELPADFPPAAGAPPGRFASLALRRDDRARIITWTTASRRPEVDAAVAQLLRLADEVLGGEAPGGNAAALTPEEAPRWPVLPPARTLPFKSVIQATTQRTLVEFNTADPAHARLKDLIARAAQQAGERALTEGIFTARANEAGNAMQSYVKAALQEVGLAPRTPRTTAGRAQATGYPDLELEGPPPCYLELKTYSAATADSTQRTFYYSPSEHPKVTRDALHLLLAFRLERVQREGRAAFVPTHWKLLTLQGLEVTLKYEFNQSNRGLYGDGATAAVLAEGAVEPEAAKAAD